jgi:hypothetical protein
LSLIVQRGKHGSRHHILRREDFRSDMRGRSFMRSSATPRLSGIKKNAAMNRSTIMLAKNANGAECKCTAMTGKAPLR